MISKKLLNDPFIAKLVKTFTADQLICRQGEMGSTMFVIVEGMVRILNKSEGHEKLIAIPGEGEILGEKAILSSIPYRRNFTIQAKTNCTLVEIDANTLKVLLAQVPDFHLTILGLVLGRLDKANHLIKILQKTDQVDRLVEYILYFDQYHCKKVGVSTEAGLTAEEVQLAANIDPHLIKESFQELASRGIMIERSGGFQLQDRQALLNYVSTLKYMMAA